MKKAWRRRGEKYGEKSFFKKTMSIKIIIDIPANLHMFKLSKEIELKMYYILDQIDKT